MAYRDTEFGMLQILIADGKPHFLASATAKMLGYANPSKAIKDHCKGVTKRYTLTNGGEQLQNFIPEGDLYRLIIRSKLPSAERFERWVFDEVLPQIRATGGYGAGGKSFGLTPQDDKAGAGAYRPKYWKGAQVVTTADAMALLGVGRHKIARYARRYGAGWSAGAVAYLGSGEVWALKRENPEAGIRATSDTRIFTREGFEALAALMGCEAQWPGAMRQAAIGGPKKLSAEATEALRIAVASFLPEDKAAKPAQMELMKDERNMGVSAEARACIKEIRGAMEGLGATLMMYERGRLESASGPGNPIERMGMHIRNLTWRLVSDADYWAGNVRNG